MVIVKLALFVLMLLFCASAAWMLKEAATPAVLANTDRGTVVVCRVEAAPVK